VRGTGSLLVSMARPKAANVICSILANETRISILSLPSLLPVFHWALGSSLHRARDLR
jgi:hypothetical protein